MSTSKPLFDDAETSSSSEEEEEENGDKLVRINKKYARDFTARKEKEELRRVRFEGGNEDDKSSSSSESEDENAELLTNKLDVDILKTINALRSKDSRIYDSAVRFFEENKAGDGSEGSKGNDDVPKKARKAKSKRYKDVVRERIMEKMDKQDVESGDDDSPPRGYNQTTSRLAYDAQQQEFRKAFLDSTTGDDYESDEEVITQKKKVVAQDPEIRSEFEAEMERMRKTGEGKGTLVDPRGEVKDSEAYLLDFFKNKPWIQHHDDDSDSQAEYTEQSRAAGLRGDDDENDDSSLHDLEEADNFEAQYNFRFEEAANMAASGAELSLQTYARRGVTLSTLRRKDESRSEKRKARKERKASQRKAKEEQLKRLKNAKRQEMEGKLNKIKSVLGEVDRRAIDEASVLKLMEGDFDPEQFEKLMNETYNDSFYGQDDEEWKDDQAVRESLKRDEDGEIIAGVDDDDGGLYDNQEEIEEEDWEDEEGCDNEEEWPHYLDEPVEAETKIERTLRAKIEDELYKLDYEDIVAGIPTRFKYRQVEPNSYGLSTEEILLSRDSTLKQFVSLKKLAPYADREHFVSYKKRRRFRDVLKQDLEEEQRQGDEKHESAEQTENPKLETKKKRRRLKKGKRKEDTADTLAETRMENDTRARPVDEDAFVSKRHDKKNSKKRRRKAKNTLVESASEVRKDHNDETAEAAKVQGATGQVATRKPKTVKKHNKRRKHKMSKTIKGVSNARLSSYGL